MIIHCWDTRVQSYPTYASKIKSINCSAWPFLYFLFTADDWNICDTFLSPWTKRTFFLFFKILIRYWDTEVLSYLTSACKIFGVARKRRVPVEKCSYQSTIKATVFKEKDWSKRGIPATSTRCPDHLSRQLYIWGFRARQHLRSLAPVMNDDWWWQRWPNDIRGPWGPKASRHLCYRWGKTPKKPHPGNSSRLGIEPGPAAWQACMLLPDSQRWTQQPIPDHRLYLSIQLQNSSAEHIHAFYTCLCVFVSVYVCLCEWVCLLRVRHVGKVWICSAEEFLELYGKVEAIIRNCLLRWSEHLVEVAFRSVFFFFFFNI